MITSREAVFFLTICVNKILFHVCVLFCLHVQEGRLTDFSSRTLNEVCTKAALRPIFVKLNSAPPWLAGQGGDLFSSSTAIIGETIRVGKAILLNYRPSLGVVLF